MKKELIKPQNIKHKKFLNEKNIFVLAVICPTFAGYTLFTLYPNILSVYYSLLDWDGVSKPVFVGLTNYITLFQDKFMYSSLSHNVIMVIFIPVFTILLSVFLADLIVNRYLKGTDLYKVIFFFPNVLSVVIFGLIFTFVYDSQYGILNAILKQIGLGNGMNWLGDVNTALPAVMVAMIWMGVGFYLVIISNAMSAIPKSLYESAILDGITNTKRLFQITIPLISPVIRICLLLLVLGVFKSFEFIMVLTRGGPGDATNVIGNYMFSYAFAAAGGSVGQVTVIPNFGYASTIGVMLAVILIGGKLIADKIFKEEAAQF